MAEVTNSELKKHIDNLDLSTEAKAIVTFIGEFSSGKRYNEEILINWRDR